MDDLNTYLTKETIMENKQMKTCTTSLVVKELQIKMTMKYYYISPRMAKI